MAGTVRPSVLDRVGEEIQSVVVPVSICMAMTVALVRYLMPHGAAGASGVAIATVYYHEKASDSAGTKFEGSLINSLIFIGIIGSMTFVLFLLFKYRCTKVIYGYFGFAGFSIFAVLGGSVALGVLIKAGVAIDVYTFALVLYNFSVGGVLFTFYLPGPLVVKQGYLVFVGTIVAFWFTKIPEWTTWMLLAAMSLYDLCAVLLPGGPLKVLVELAEERDEDIPALVYEARPTSSTRSTAELRQQREHAARRRQQQRRARQQGGHTGGARRNASVGVEEEDGVGAENSRTVRPDVSGEGAPAGGAEGAWTAPTALGDAAAGGSASPPPSPPSEAEDAQDEETRLLPPADEGADADAGTLTPPARVSARGRGPSRHGREQQRRSQDLQEEGDDDDDDDDMMLPDAIKLGLGDFIFYSVLVGRAAMYDLSTVVASYLAIVAGLGATLLLLAVYQKALPALPISIALGMAFYFITRFVLEPFTTSMSTSLVWA